MKIIEAIQRVDALKPNVYSQTDKLMWLSRLDMAVRQQIFDRHEANPAPDFRGYTAETSKQTQLLVCEPFDEMYLRWLEAQIDYHNGEIDRYENSMAMYNAVYEAFSAHYTRCHRPLAGRRFLF